MTKTIFRKTTSKGQITIPKSWRKDFNTGSYVLQKNGMKITILPLEINEDKYGDEENWISIFDSNIDNNGKTLKAKYLIDLIEKINKEEAK